MPAIEPGSAPGHLLRRAQQAHTALWAQLVSDQVTSVQFVILNCLEESPNIDQTTLGQAVHIDRSTTADVVARLVDRGFVERTRDMRDRRRSILNLTGTGRRIQAEALPAVEELGKRLLTPLSASESRDLMRLLTKLVQGLEAVTEELAASEPTDNGSAVSAHG